MAFSLLSTRLSVIFVLCFTLFTSATMLYKGFSVLELQIDTELDLDSLRHLLRYFPVDVKMWTDIPPNYGLNTVLISPQVDLGVLKKNVLKIIHNDVQTLLEEEGGINQKTKYQSDNFFTSYHKLEEINTFIDSLASKYPKLAYTFDLGTTYEGRKQHAILIGTNSSNPVIFFEGGVHAREWISPATVTYFIYHLITDYDAESNSTKYLVDNLNWVILPVTNPDGYVYTYTNDRMWRKNRFPTGFFQNGSQCIGVDLNRNWNYSFSSDDPNPNPCSEGYPGKAGFDQPEILALTNAIANFVENNGIYLFIDWHSCGQLWMYPWAFSTNQAPFWNLQSKLGNVALNALSAVHGTNYTLGPIAVTIYQVGGSSVDWTFDVQNIIYSYGVELRDTGHYCFVLPADQIIPTAEESWAAVKAMGKYLLQNPPFTGK